MLHTAAARVGGLDLGFVPGEGGLDAASMLTETDVLFLLGADEMDLHARKTGAVSPSISAPMAMSARTMPTSSCRPRPIPRNPATYVNTEGRVQMTTRAGFAPGEAKEDWAILRALSDTLGKKLPFDSLAQLRAKLYEAHPHFAVSTRSSPAHRAMLLHLRKKAEKQTSQHLHRRSKTSI